MSLKRVVSFTAYICIRSKTDPKLQIFPQNKNLKYAHEQKPSSLMKFLVAPEFHRPIVLIAFSEYPILDAWVAAPIQKLCSLCK